MFRRRPSRPCSGGQLTTLLRWWGLEFFFSHGVMWSLENGSFFFCWNLTVLGRGQVLRGKRAITFSNEKLCRRFLVLFRAILKHNKKKNVLKQEKKSYQINSAETNYSHDIFTCSSLWYSPETGTGSYIPLLKKLKKCRHLFFKGLIKAVSKLFSSNNSFNKIQCFESYFVVFVLKQKYDFYYGKRKM